MDYTVYILFSQSCTKFYTGQTQNFENRIIEHNTGETKSIKSCIPWSVIWKQNYLIGLKPWHWKRKSKTEEHIDS